MASKIYTFCLSIVFLFVGASAFVPGFRGPPSPMYDASNHKMHLGYCLLFNQLPMNYLLSGILLGFGLSGVLVCLTPKGPRTWCQIVFFAFLLMMAIGLCPQPLASVFGFLPLYSWTCGICLITAVASTYSAFFDGPVPEMTTAAVFRQ